MSKYWFASFLSCLMFLTTATAHSEEITGRTFWDIVDKYLPTVVGVVYSEANNYSGFTESSTERVEVKEVKEPSFCKQAKSDAEHFICSTRELWSLENLNKATYDTLYQSAPPEQHIWRKYRDSLCSTQNLNSCTRVYEQRLSVLKDRADILKGILKPRSTSQPSWCDKKLNTAERRICNDERVWFYDDTLRQLYHEEVKNNSLDLKTHIPRRHAECEKSTLRCIAAYHEDIFYLTYELSMK